MPTRTERFDLNALLETSRLLASSLEVDFVLNSLLLTAMSKLLVSRGVVLLDDPLSGGFRVEAAKGRLSDALAPDSHVRFTSPNGVAEGEAVPEPLRSAGIELLLPITYHERRLGLIGLGRKPGGEGFAPAERDFIDALVHMSATAVHNAWAVEELRQANVELGHKVQMLNTLFDVAQGFTAAPDVEKVTRTLALTLMGQFMVRRFTVLLRSGEGGSLEVAATRHAPTIPSSLFPPLDALRRLMLLDDDAPAELGPLRDDGFALALPLRMQDITRGILLLGPKMSGQAYAADDVEFLTALGQLALTAIENARGLEARIENERLEEELRLAREIQERLLPQQLPALAGAELAALNVPSRYVAGDYYDALALDDARLLVAVADVSGKGLPASLLMANLQACIHVVADSLASGTVDLATATARVNRVIHRNTSLTSFITFFWAIIDSRDGTITYVNAGHNPPLLIRTDGRVDPLDVGGVILGILSDIQYEQGTAKMEPGDAVVLYTDGITEAWSATDPDDEFGEERLLETLLRSDRTSACATLEAVQKAVTAHSGVGPLDDDLTLIIVCRR